MIRMLFKIAFYVCILCLLIHSWLTYKEYLFDHDEIHATAKKYAGLGDHFTFNQIIRELREKYPGHILPDKDLQWIFVNAGGWMGSICVLHASITEYVALFGAAIDTSGHSGRYWANITDTILSGVVTQWKEGQIKSIQYRPGDLIFHAWGEATAVKFAGGTWMFEYGRGFIPSTLGFTFADTIFSTQDFFTFYYTLRVYAKCLLLEGTIYFTEFMDYMTGHKAS